MNETEQSKDYSEWKDKLFNVFIEGVDKFGTELAVGNVQSLIQLYYWRAMKFQDDTPKKNETPTTFNSDFNSEHIPTSDPILPPIGEAPGLHPLPPYQPKKNWFQKLVEKNKR